MSKIDLVVYLAVGCAGCLMLVTDAGAPLWLAIVLSVAAVLAGSRPVRREDCEGQ